MAAFEYQALDGAQRVKKGVVQADTPRQARALLRDQGLVPLEVEAVANTHRVGRHWRAGHERTLILRQLATLLRAGMTLEEVLTVLTDQADRASTRRAMGAIRSRVLEGASLSRAMAEHPGLFPRLYHASVAAGERTGQLEAVLGQLADYAHSRETMGRGLGLALIYPALLGFIALVVVSALIGFVVPRVVNVFDQAGQTLPWVTRSLLWMADTVGQFGFFGITILVGLMVLLAVALKKPEMRWRFDRWCLSWPLVGPLLRAQQTALFSRTLAILTGSAVPLVEALGVSGAVLGNRAAAGDIEQVAKKVSEGVSLSKALSPIEWLSGIAKRLIHAGEKSGELASMLQQSAEIEERALASAQSVTLSVIQPLMILLVGGIVLYIVLAIMLPILNMSQLLGSS